MTGFSRIWLLGINCALAFLMLRFAVLEERKGNAAIVGETRRNGCRDQRDVQLPSTGSRR